MVLNSDQLKKAFKSNPPQFSSSDYVVGNHQFESCLDLLSLVMHDYACGDSYPDKNMVLRSIKHKITYMLNTNGVPSFDNSYNWSYAALAQAIMLIHNKQDLWDLFTELEKSKITFIMKMFAYMWNFGCSGHNDFRTGIGLHGKYSKNLNPNYILCNNALIIYCTHFFGGLDKVSEILSAANYDEIIKTLRFYGFKNAYAIWTTSGIVKADGSKTPGARELFEGLDGEFISAYIPYPGGNILYAGRGKGGNLPYLYRDTSIESDLADNYPTSVLEYVIDKTFSGGVCTDNLRIDTEDDFTTYIASGNPSPYVGQDGMMLEFNGVDMMGMRSSLAHSQVDFYLIASLILSLKEVGFDALINPERKRKCIVGMNDCLHKLANNYVGYSLGKIENNTKQFNFDAWIDAWNEYCATEGGN